MKKIIAFGLVFAAGIGLGQVASNVNITRADPGRMTAVAVTYADAFERGKTQARNPEQISQLADETNIPLQLMIVRQNDEIIRLLRKLNKEKY